MMIELVAASAWMMPGDAGGACVAAPGGVAARGCAGTRQSQQRAPLDPVPRGFDSQRLEKRRHRVDSLDEALLRRSAGGVSRGIGVVEKKRHAQDRVVEKLLFSEPVIAQVVAVIGSEDDERVVPQVELVEQLPQPPEMIVDLADESHVDGLHRVDDLVAREIDALLVLAVGGIDRVRIVEFGPVAKRR